MSRTVGQIISSEAERGTLAILISFGAAALASVPWLSNNHFGEVANQRIFGVIAALEADVIPIDLITVTQKARDTGVLDEIGGAAALTSLVTGESVLPSMLPVYTGTLERTRKRRVIYEGCARGMADAVNGELDPLEVSTKIEDTLHEVDTQEESESRTTESIADVRERIITHSIGGTKGLSTGVEVWDEMPGKLKPGRMIILGARPKIGKTSLAETMIEHQISNGQAVLVFQRDMSLGDMVCRMACRRARVPYFRFEEGKCTGGELERVRAAVDSYDKLKDKLLLYSPVNMTPGEMRGTLKREIRQSGVQAVYLDVFQRIRVLNNLTEGLTQASKDIRDMCNDFELPWVILAHLNKDADETKRPHAGQFKYCDQLFADCDTAVLMWTDEDPKQLEQPDGTLKRQHVILTVDGNRGGSVGDRSVYFDRPLMTFHTHRVDKAFDPII